MTQQTTKNIKLYLPCLIANTFVQDINIYFSHISFSRDAVITSGINCGTSFLAGFAVFAVLGHMAHVQNTDVKNVAREGESILIYVGR